MTYYSNKPVYKAISDRFLSFRPQIKIGEHIDTMKEIGRTISEGITFVPKNSSMLRFAIATTRINEKDVFPAFHWDNRKIWINKLAALFTDGEGYREIGTPSLHCAIGKEECSVHIDEFGFVERGRNGGTYFNPESFRHIFDELTWRAIVRPQIIKGLQLALPVQLSEPASKLLDKTYLVLPSAENNYDFKNVNLRVDGSTLQGSDFEPRAGAGIKLIENKKVNLKFEYTCGNVNCTDNQAMVKLSVDLDS
jgi:hypothetical protein